MAMKMLSGQDATSLLQYIFITVANTDLLLILISRENIFEFMHIKLGVPREKAHAIWYPLFKEYNQSLKVIWVLPRILRPCPLEYLGILDKKEDIGVIASRNRSFNRFNI